MLTSLGGKARGRTDGGGRRSLSGVVTDHCMHLRQGVVDTFDATISARVVGPYREFTFAEGFEHGGGELGAEFKSVVGQEDGGASPERGVAVHQEVGSAFDRKFGCGDIEHVRTAAEPIHGEEDVRISLGCYRQRAKAVDTDRALASEQFGGRSYALDISGSGAPTILYRLPYQSTSRNVKVN